MVMVHQSQSSTQVELANLAGDVQRYKNTVAEAEAKATNLAKRVEVETRALRETVRYCTSAPCQVLAQLMYAGM